MFKGFYNLTSGMLTQGRHLDILSNNIANIPTSGFKGDRFTASTFQEVMWSRVGNMVKHYEDIGEQSWITAPSQMYTDFTQGTLDQTFLPLDFAINGEGWFAIENLNPDQDLNPYDDPEAEDNPENPEEAENPGNEERRIEYTRSGSFALDNEGYLVLPGQGYVLDINRERIRLVTDKLHDDGYGGLFTEAGGYLGRIGIFVFEDNEAQLEKNNQGLFVSEAEPQVTTTPLINGYLERSNVDWVKNMTEMISAQRAYQSMAELTQIYDTVMNRITQEVGRLS